MAIGIPSAAAGSFDMLMSGGAAEVRHGRLPMGRRAIYARGGRVSTFLEDEPPALVDWLPWNHTFGGNHNIGMAVYNGGTF